MPFMECTFDAVPLNDAVRRINKMLKDFADATPNVKFFDPTPYLCASGACSAVEQSGMPIYFDSHHLTSRASWKIGAEILHNEGVPSAFRSIAGWRQTSHESRQGQTGLAE